MTDNRDELAALANKFECCVPTDMKQPDGSLETKYVVCYPERQHNIIVSALRSAASSAAVPVAWLQSQNGVEIVSKHRLDQKAFEYGWTERPLYATPGAAGVRGDDDE